jgi:hypothetical protein
VIGCGVVGGQDEELEEAASQREGAVARKNLSLSRCARRSCSWEVSGLERPLLMPGVEVV